MKKRILILGVVFLNMGFILNVFAADIVISKEAVKNNNVPEVKKAIEKGADVNASDSEGHVVLDYAKDKGHTQMITLLKNYGAK